MVNFLNNIEIKNFKSIKHIETDCKRVNIFIGKPNVGKSNILEALGLLGAHYSQDYQKFLKEFIRYEEISNLFYDDDLLNVIEVNTDKARAILNYHTNNNDYADLMIGYGDWMNVLLNEMKTGKSAFILFRNEYELSNRVQEESKFIAPYFISVYPKGNLLRGSSDILRSTLNPIKKYSFKEATEIANKFPSYLLPPYGNNLFTIIDHNKELRKEISEIFSEYGLQFVAYKKESKFEIEKNIDGYVSKFHYSSIADTFQRLIFYYAAIDSNKNSILIFEEPEVHSFPPYTKELSERIINSTDNQFFITTHSPYLLQNLISNLDSTELNVFITYFENYETKIRKLSDDELRKASAFSVDLFYNLNQFVPNA